MSYSNELQHHGVKGMKWGVRKARGRTGPGTKVTSKNQQKRINDRNIRNERKQTLKARRNMSEQDLDRAINRLKKEKQLKDLIQEDIAPGRTIVSESIRSLGSKAIGAAVVGSLAYLGKVSLDKDFNLGEAAKYIFPNPNKKK